MAVLLLAAFPLKGQEFKERLDWAANGNILYFPEDNDVGGDPAPILPSLGADLAYHFIGPLWAEFTEDLYFTHYAYNYSLDRAVPAAIENRSAFVFGLLTGFQALGRFPLEKNPSGSRAFARVYMGPAIDFRIVTLAGNLHPDDFTGIPASDPKIQTDSVRKYLWGKGRWFLPVTGVGMDFAINEQYMLGFDLRVWYPAYRLWSKENLPPIEGWRFGAGIRISPRHYKPVQEEENHEK